tara:strand:- start:8399 stop:8794 length:396 start_codon:yes stop_codon:yes gene_type:complete
MEKNFKIEIISPEKLIFSGQVNMATLPSYEGDMSILKDHISIITFLRPGKITVEKNEGNYEKFFVEDGTVEFFSNNLVVLSSSAKNVKDLSKDYLNKLEKNTTDQLSKKDITDRERYILNHKIDALKEIRL